MVTARHHPPCLLLAEGAKGISSREHNKGSGDDAKWLDLGLSRHEAFPGIKAMIREVLSRVGCAGRYCLGSHTAGTFDQLGWLL